LSYHAINGIYSSTTTAYYSYVNQIAHKNIIP
jgi:hypothetical protein